jgi:hypothetical protein
MVDPHTTAEVIHLDPRWIAFRQGERDFAAGQHVENVWTDDEWMGRLGPGQCHWLGFMIARSRTIGAGETDNG